MSTSTLLLRDVMGTALGGVSLAGRIEQSRGLPRSPMRVLGSYALVYVVAGGGWYADALGAETPVTAGDLILVFPDLPHAYGPGARWDEVFLVFDGPVFRLWEERGLLDRSRPIRHLEPVERWAERLCSVLDGDPLQRVCRLQEVLAEVYGRTPATLDDGDHWLARAKALLDADVRRERDLREVAAELHLSYDGFRKRFSRLAGIGPARYRWQASIERACELMALGTMTDRQIAAMLCFTDEFYFSRRFKQMTGRSPRQFRTALRQSKSVQVTYQSPDR
ncbi:AraC family transcriptional regulator [Nonomuraea sp. NPDC059194]|uniref:AraC family transcriptional regulator n=1 Tax=Nonomuraea sp. NPDC059194 TaxID=3346764 RepID=UPI0036816A2E